MKMSKVLHRIDMGQITPSATDRITYTEINGFWNNEKWAHGKDLSGVYKNWR